MPRGEPHPIAVNPVQEKHPTGLPIILQEYSGIERVHEPVTVGIPFPQGLLSDRTQLRLLDPQNHPVPLQVDVLARWFDDSIQWALLDFQANVPAEKVVEYRLQWETSAADVLSPTILLTWQGATLLVDTGEAVFSVNTEVFKPFDRVVSQGRDILEPAGSEVVFTDDKGRRYEARIDKLTVEVTGPLRVTLKAQGTFQAVEQLSVLRFVARLSFYARSGLVDVQFTLHNPQAAQHPGGFWELGDAGSIYFRDLSLHISLPGQRTTSVAWIAQLDQPGQQYASADVEIYQDSSGGLNWQSANHVNRSGKVMQTFRGYRVTVDGNVAQEGYRATPLLALGNEEYGITTAIENFWQNFPKALEARQGKLSIRLFPQQYQDVYELQGGEQKTHRCFLSFEHTARDPIDLRWLHDRLIPRTTPAWYAYSGALSYLVARHPDMDAHHIALIDAAINGSNTFFDRREVIDEYGWRHFGDLYADHEAVGYPGKTPLVAHYNNQYDVIYGFLIQYAATGEQRWFALLHDLARHVIDIDIYHTQQDRQVYNGGLFWHTDHYADAATATHRTFSQAQTRPEAQWHATYRPGQGGGPNNEHNYTTGLLYYYFMTGDRLAFEAVESLARWTIQMDDGSKRKFGKLDRRPTGFSSTTAGRYYHGPGRGSGNSINALLDGYLLTRQPQYMEKAEQLIQRCIHPHDDISRRNLDDIEYRWSYTVFLQALGKYLDMKSAQGDCDRMYHYARASLLHYAQWMLTHEVPYKTVLDKVDIPTETWPAQDIRKSCVFKFAAKYADEPLRSQFLEKSSYFFHTCIRDLTSYGTCSLTRPLSLILLHGYMHYYVLEHVDTSIDEQMNDFGQPERFTFQFYEFYKARDVLKNLQQRKRQIVSSLHKAVQSLRRS